MTYQRNRTQGTSTSERDANNRRINVQIQPGYLSIQDQLDQLWHDIDDGKLDKTGSWYLAVKAVKDKYAKP